MTNEVWILGRGGMLGGRLAKECSSRSTFSVWESPVEKYSWRNSQEIKKQIEESATAFFAHVQKSGQPWTIVWAAGAGVVGSTAESLGEETAVWSHLLACIEPLALRGNGSVFFSSSAGTVYGQGTEAFTEHSPLLPISPYGKEKVKQEEIFREWSAKHPETSCITGRISNLYGEEQNLEKPQGIISHLLRACLHRKPLHIFVPLTTIRDYVYVGDAARAIADCIEHIRAQKGLPAYIVKLFASEQSTTIAELLADARRITRRPPPVTYGFDSRTTITIRSLNFHSVELPEIRLPRETSLLEGMHKVYTQQSSLFARGLLPPR